ncbi:MAG: hypothetical protein IT462_14385 [Planctomycetes bacterium]|nr:hypothetical protein [Planctomycetota bacterium]
MKNLRSSILTILGIASLTMVASLALLAPQGASAVDEPAKTADTLRRIKPEIAVPKLVEDECTITIKTDKESYVAGDGYLGPSQGAA